MKIILAILALFVAAAAIYTLVSRFKAFFIILGILALIGVALYGYLKIQRKKKHAPSASEDPTPGQDAVKNQPSKEDVKPATATREYEVAGVEYYMKNLLSMMEPNYLYSYKKQDLIDTCNYDVPIYKTACNATNLQLVQEDDNPHDPNAVLVLLDDKIVGYIARKDCKHIRHLMDNDLIEKFTCRVYGGKYKQVNEEYDWEKDKYTYSTETGEDDYGITVVITEKAE